MDETELDEILGVGVRLLFVLFVLLTIPAIVFPRIFGLLFIIVTLSLFGVASVLYFKTPYYE